MEGLTCDSQVLQLLFSTATLDFTERQPSSSFL
uniref:Uncharacterized protein n=1 Tax=Anguilla anguilla TaxID=7936 RepID=A0A0E9TT73_ANGAN